MATLHAAARPVNLLKRPISQGTKCCSANKLRIFRTSNKPSTHISTDAPLITVLVLQEYFFTSSVRLYYCANESLVTELLLKPNSGLLQFMILRHVECSVAINNSELLCRRLYSQVCIYSSLCL